MVWKPSVSVGTFMNSDFWDGMAASIVVELVTIKSFAV
jgi:hypothetical protein